MALYCVCAVLCYDRQIVLFAGAMELYFWKQDPAGEPGNVGGAGWSVRYKDQEVRDNKLVKELKV
jgi:hypothetical protein